MATSEGYEPADQPPDAKALKLIAALRAEQIDSALMNAADHNWRKVARIVGAATGTLSGRVPGVPDIFYAQRIESLVTQGRLDFQGDLSRMRYSEVRIPIAGR